MEQVRPESGASLFLSTSWKHKQETSGKKGKAHVSIQKSKRKLTFFVGELLPPPASTVSSCEICNSTSEIPGSGCTESER